MANTTRGSSCGLGLHIGFDEKHDYDDDILQRDIPAQYLVCALLLARRVSEAHAPQPGGAGDAKQ